MTEGDLGRAVDNANCGICRTGMCKGSCDVLSTILYCEVLGTSPTAGSDIVILPLYIVSLLYNLMLIL